MDNRKKLTQWILDFSEALCLETERLNWTKDWLDFCFDYRTSIKINGNFYEGRGIAKSEELAFVKSVSEAIERAVCDSLSIRSNGVAVHTNYEEAKNKALQELLERDIFLCHYLTKRPFNSFSNLKSYSYLKDVKKKLNRSGFDLKAYEYRANGFIFIFFEAINELNNKFIGLKLSPVESDSVFSALTECLSNTVAFIHDRTSFEALTADEFKAIKKHTPRDHAKLYNWNHPQKSTLTPKPNQLEVNHHIDFKKFKLKQIVPNNDLLRSAPLYIIKVSSAELQDVFYGFPEEENINLERLKKFSRINLSFDNLETVPHPLG